MIGTIAARELRLLFASPLAWSILAVVQALMAYVFLTRVELFMQYQPRIAALEVAPGVTDLVIAPMLGSAGMIMLLVVPLLTMGSIAGERRAQSFALLLSSPVSLTAVVLGKFLSLLVFSAVLTALIAVMALSLLAGAALDPGQLAGGLLALLLLLATSCAIGLFISSATSQPAVAAVATFGVLLGLWIIDWAGATDAASSGTTLIGYLSMTRHYEPLLRGMLSSVDLGYFALMTTVFLTLTVWRLDAERLLA
jgi:ABC-2 type transport system permease protein